MCTIAATPPTLSPSVPPFTPFLPTAAYYRTLFASALGLQNDGVTISSAQNVDTGLTEYPNDGNYLAAASWGAPPPALCTAVASAPTRRALQEGAGPNASAGAVAVIIRTVAAPADFHLLAQLMGLNFTAMELAFEGQFI